MAESVLSMFEKSIVYLGSVQVVLVEAKPMEEDISLGRLTILQHRAESRSRKSVSAIFDL